MNDLSAAASRELRFIGSQEVVDRERGSRDTLIRFEVRARSAAELQAAIGRGTGQIRIGATATRVQQGGRDIAADTTITFSLQK